VKCAVGLMPAPHEVALSDETWSRSTRGDPGSWAL
jgi:hypothetical protein